MKTILNKLKKNKLFFYFYFKYKKSNVLFLSEKEKNFIYNNFPLGINKEKRGEKIIVSLTTFPSRINEVYFTIYSILNQSCKPDKVILWLTHEEFPNKEVGLPQRLLNLKSYGLEICWCNNIRSYNKLIPTLKLYSNNIILTIDDDIYYDEHMIEYLYKAYLKSDKRTIICHRAHKINFDNNGNIASYNKWDKNIKGLDISYRNLLTGVGGVLYPSNIFYKDVDNINLIKSICPTADDIWFWAMAVLNNTKICVIENNISNLKYVNLEKQLKGINTLESINVFANKNDEQIKILIKSYPQIVNIIQKGE